MTTSQQQQPSAGPDARGGNEAQSQEAIPSWLATPQAYEPLPDRDRFVSQSMLAVTSVLARLRMDDGAPGRLSPSAPAKLAYGLAAILMVSLSRNFLFVAAVLAFVVVRAALLPQRQLTRVAAVSGTAALMALVLMLPAALLGQTRSAVTIAAKALVSTGLAMEVALTTPTAQLTSALRAYHVPDLVILTIDLALRSIVRLGEVALEALTALKLRSVGRNDHKGASMGGIGGVVLVKASEASRTTYDAMRCRGFEGNYEVRGSWRPTAVDRAWGLGLALLAGLFSLTQGMV